MINPCVAQSRRLDSVIFRQQTLAPPRPTRNRFLARFPFDSFKLTQSGVDENFGMIVPLYLDLGKGQVVKLGNAPLVGNHTIEKQVPLAGMQTTPKRLVVNYFNDVLAITEGK